MFLAHDAPTSSPPSSDKYSTRTHRRSQGVVVGSNKRDARALHGHTHSHDVLSAGAGLAAQYSRQSDAAQPYKMPAVPTCALPRHATDSFLLLLPFARYPLPSLRSPGHSARARCLFSRGGPSLAPCLSGLWSRHRNTSQLLKRSLLPFLSPFCFGEKLGSIWGYS